MIEWKPCSEPPTKDGRILVKIGDAIFLGDVYASNISNWHFGPIPRIDYIRPIIFPTDSCAGWNYPTHFKEPEYWMELPE